MRSYGVFLVVGLLGCSNAVGRPCVNPGGQPVNGTQLSLPALECPSRLCLIEPAEMGGSRATCTADCEGDGDCDVETRASCAAGFACAVATTTGPFACRKLCVCRDDLEAGKNVDASGKVIPPCACDTGHARPDCR